MFFAKLHPLWVHFPMSLLISGALFQLIGSLQREETIVLAGRYNILFGFWMMLPAIFVGGLSLLNLEVESNAQPFLNSHIWFSAGTFVIFAIGLAIQKYQENSWAKTANYVLLAAGLICVLATGFYGGELVHRFGLPLNKSVVLE